MSAKQDSSKPAGQTKKFGKGEREVPHHTQKAKKFYPAEDEYKPKKVCVQVIRLDPIFGGIFFELQRLSMGSQQSPST